MDSLFVALICTVNSCVYGLDLVLNYTRKDYTCLRYLKDISLHHCLQIIILSFTFIHVALHHPRSVVVVIIKQGIVQ